MYRFPFALVIAFCVLFTHESNGELPQHSQLIDVSDSGPKPRYLHLRTLGQPQSGKPTLVLLSGPTDNWHSDSGWWLVTQQYFENHYQTIAIDRAGQAWSSPIEAPSYSQFSDDLNTALNQLDLGEIIIVAFASSNIAVNLLLDKHPDEHDIAAVLMIDPDVLQPFSIEHYTEESEGFRANWQQLADYINVGKYDQRIIEILSKERDHIESIIPAELLRKFDWQTYHAIEAIRGTRAFQLGKFRETTSYKTDLVAAAKADFPSNIPLLIIDTDFEQGYLERMAADAPERTAIEQWRQEAQRWYFEQAERGACGSYWPVVSQEHLLPVSDPELISRAVEKLRYCPN